MMNLLYANVFNLGLLWFGEWFLRNQEWILDNMIQYE